MKNKITLKELSKLLNVSVSTVSKALETGFSSGVTLKNIEILRKVMSSHLIYYNLQLISGLNLNKK